MFPFLSHIASARALILEPSFSDFPQYLGLISVCVLSGREAPCTAAPFFAHYPWFLDIKGSGTVKSTLQLVGTPSVEFWLCHLHDVDVLTQGVCRLWASVSFRYTVCVGGADGGSVGPAVPKSLPNVVFCLQGAWYAGHCCL